MIKKLLPYIYCIVIAVGACLVVNYTLNQRLAYINIKQVFDSFSLKQENEKKLKLLVDAHKNILDSLESRLKLMSIQFNKLSDIPKAKVEEFNLLKDEYLYTKGEFEKQQEILTKQYDDEIFKQLNQYVKEFGEKHSYTVILGAQGSGSVVYGKEKYDITKEVISFINDKYLGK